MLKTLTDNLFLSKQGWLCIKLGLVLHWLPDVGRMLWQADTIPFPTGLCALVPCTIFLPTAVKAMLLVLMVAGSIFYLLEKRMSATLALLAVLSIISISLHESGGMFLRASLYSMVWVGQLLAYLVYTPNSAELVRFRHQFPVQLIAATYTLAAISKYWASGLHWPADGASYMAVQSFKGFAYAYYDALDPKTMREGLEVVAFMVDHSAMIYALLAGALLVETTVLLATLDRRITLLYGVLLFLMHMGIYFLMDIIIAGTYYSMLMFFVNPLGMVYFGFMALKKRLGRKK
jgi:hypothetical protein